MEDFEDKYPSCFDLKTNMDTKVISVSNFEICLETQFATPSNVIDSYCTEKAMHPGQANKKADSPIIKCLKS